MAQGVGPDSNPGIVKKKKKKKSKMDLKVWLKRQSACFWKEGRQGGRQAIYNKSIAYVLLNRKKLKPLPLKSGMRHGCPLSLPLFNSYGIPSQSSKTEKKIKRNSNRKRGSQIIRICR
jgi:hypothetical protein